MKIAMIGCGKLGFPVAMAWATKHDVVGYDASPAAKEILAARKYPHREERGQELIESTTMKIVDTVDEAVAHAEIVFVAVQTPHLPEFEGLTRMPEHRADFDYKTLREAVDAVQSSAFNQRKQIVLVVISTVLPGTSARELYPCLSGNSYVSYVYSPMFIAMGTTILDAMKPEMVLLGVEPEQRGHALEMMKEFYKPLHEAPLCPMLVESAELAKVAYNVFLGLKIVAANSVMEIAHKTGADCDEVTDALALATDRVVSPKYMRGGMGDGGGCHPRDQIALSWLAQKLDLSYDLFGSMILAREEQTEWLAEIALAAAKVDHIDPVWKVQRGTTFYPIVVLGKAYKKGTNLTLGSPAILLKNILDEKNQEASADGVGELVYTIDQWDPHIDPPRTFSEPAVFVIAADHDEFFAPDFVLPAGSVVIDPWGKMPDQTDVRLVKVGRR